MSEERERLARIENIILELNKSGLSYLTHCTRFVFQNNTGRPSSTSNSPRRW
jgi:hypothetical protein